jgi:hypothetical protein
MKPNAYTTMQRARSLRERQPDASPSHVAIAVIMASFADGPTGTSIRPGVDRVAELTGLTLRTVQRGIRWLEERGELRRDKNGWRGSAACFTWLGGAPEKGVTEAALSEQKGVTESRKGRHSRRPTTHTPQQPSGLPGPRDGAAPQIGEQGECAACAGPLGYLVEGDNPADGALCLACFNGR